MADGTLRLTIDTQELPATDLAKLFALHQATGWFVFNKAELTKKDIPDVPVEFKEQKSPSQRLRNVVYVYWEKNTSKLVPFDDYWKRWVEKLIDQMKEKL